MPARATRSAARAGGRSGARRSRSGPPSAPARRLPSAPVRGSARRSWRPADQPRRNRARANVRAAHRFGSRGLGISADHYATWCTVRCRCCAYDLSPGEHGDGEPHSQDRRGLGRAANLEIDGQIVPNYDARLRPPSRRARSSRATSCGSTRREVLVDIGYKSEGVIPANELSIRKAVDPHDEGDARRGGRRAGPDQGGTRTAG